MNGVHCGHILVFLKFKQYLLVYVYEHEWPLETGMWNWLFLLSSCWFCGLNSGHPSFVENTFWLTSWFILQSLYCYTVNLYGLFSSCAYAISVLVTSQCCTLKMFDKGHTLEQTHLWHSVTQRLAQCQNYKNNLWSFVLCFGELFLHIFKCYIEQRHLIPIIVFSIILKDL